MSRARRFSGKQGGRSSGEIQNFSFVKGLITEASPLNFPENASIAEINFDLLRTGSRQKRKGLSTINPSKDFGFQLNTPGVFGEDPIPTEVQRSSLQAYSWKTAGPNRDLDILVIRSGQLIFFYDLAAEGYVLDNLIESFSIFPLIKDGVPVSTINSIDIQLTDGNGFLFLSGPSIQQTYIDLEEYVNNSGTIEQGLTRVVINVRDFEGLDDGLEFDERPADLTDEHLYNLVNQGWPTQAQLIRGSDGGNFAAQLPQNEFRFVNGRYPSNADIYYLGNDLFGELYRFSASRCAGAMRNVQSSPAPKGNVIYDRSGITDVPLIENTLGDLVLSSYRRDFSSNSFYSGAFYAGRYWTCDSDTIYYSQVIEGSENISKFYQDASPTNKDINELVATDGGTLVLKEAGKVIKLVPFKQYLMVFCERGVWSISGSDGSQFDATNQALLKVFNEGTKNPESIIDMDDILMYCVDSGIYAVAADGVGYPQFQNLSENTIQTYWNGLPAFTRETLRGVYDRKTRKVAILLDTVSESYEAQFPGQTYVQTYTDLLYFDTSLGAFYLHYVPPYQYTESPEYFGTIVDAIYLDTAPKVQDVDINVVTSSGEPIVTSTGINVVIEETTVGQIEDGKVLFLTRLPGPASDPGNSFVDLAEFTYDRFTDWSEWTEFEEGPGSAPGAPLVDSDYLYPEERPYGTPYVASLLTGYYNLGSIATEKSVNYVHTAMERTENSPFSPLDSVEQFENPDRERKPTSSCEMSFLWNWTDSNKLNFKNPPLYSDQPAIPLAKFGRPAEIYKPRMPIMIDNSAPDLYTVDDGEPVRLAKTKIRGRGKSFHTLFQSREYYDCRLLGWSLSVTQARNP